ncbi:AcrR family transcriptional regulator [Enterococcus sp. PF1-24]|uniref:TetR/AcrR family transcriptional regulator n=1 Tax=unclassified Enterococcus TaxID=2608891 RepID=UPI0024731A43|nr:MULTISPECIES: TetR/AcrR family transcriptional regulator [unclassified Enterococcus]MDH6365637.1 AcrR family transcriptional regulator [Enterococcus sp. PFB1-1]MDH6402738.1 AcrR family transcriptional regulator [Enterococcus sp. PF1-24]
MKKQPEITAMTKKKIKDSFWQLYQNKRIDKITVREVMDKAGYNRGTFYEYYTDVYDVLEQLENELLPNPDNMPLAPIVAGSHEGNFGFNEFFKFYEENNEYFTVLLGEHGDASFLAKIKKSVKPIIKQGLIAKGTEDNFELDVMIEYNLSAMLGVFNLWFTSKDRPSMEEFVDSVYKAGHFDINP